MLPVYMANLSHTFVFLCGPCILVALSAVPIILYCCVDVILIFVCVGTCLCICMIGMYMCSGVSFVDT